MEEPLKPESAIGSRRWKACCLVPALALAAVLLFVVGGSLFSIRPKPKQAPVRTKDTTEDFIRFGREFFAITRRADTASEQAFKALEAMLQGGGSIEDVHSAFREASTANAQASAEFKALAIPKSLQSQSKLRQSVDTMSRSYYARKLACDILVDWGGDLNDQEIAGRYRGQVEDINRLTQEGLSYLAEAARDNGITQDDARRFLPAAIFSEKNPFEAAGIPWGY